MKKITIFACMILSLSLSACSTRQVVDKLSGSTAQRLVTLSVDQLISELPESPLSELQDAKVWMNTHFIREDPIVTYASARMKTEIDKRHQVTWTDSEKDAEKVIDVFFTSLATDQDSLGISIPIPTVTTESNEIGRLDIIALNMYHGVSELYFYVRDNATKTVVKAERSKAHIRTDTLALPIITIPINTLD
ncbi:hypothetical protein A9Q81_17165 [Gammaproteobacteria bacterium 42_54_T18]|nr:hypothetical protein A9Q81_17165 [Gammaproteobacteria bacterium 42_54_T18]